MFQDAIKNRVARWIAGDVATSDNPGSSIKRWRNRFDVKQNTLAERLDISPSVISDYESGRRKSPGVGIIKRLVETLIKVDEERGGQVTRAFSNRFGAHLPPEIVLAMREFENPITGGDLVEAIGGEVLANEESLNKNIFGYTVIDSPKAILELSAEDFMGLYGLTTERALIFTGVSTGRSPLIAIKVRGITPGLVVLHGSMEKADRLGVKIAENLKVPLILSKTSKVDDLLDKLQKSKS